MISGAYLLVFRTLHVMAAIAWAGSVFLIVLFVQPSAAAVGPAGAPFMRELLGKRRLISVVLWLATTTIVAGGFLYWSDVQAYGGLGSFLDSAFGLGLTIGAVSALIAFGIGMAVTKPTIDRVMAIGAQIAQAGDPPPAELVQEMHGLQGKARAYAKANLVFVAIAAFTMSTARYW